LRLAAAVVVIIDHSAGLALFPGAIILPPEWQIAPGHVVLMGIFGMSGYQISGSWQRDPSWWRFTARRLLRILPPLLVVVLVTVFVIGPLFTTWTLPDYLASKQTWRYLVGTSVVLLVQHILPGVFWDNPYPMSVNGSLWTLPMELVGYGIVLAAGLLVALGCSRLIVVFLLAGVVTLDTLFQADASGTGLAGSWLQIPLGSLFSFMVPFVLGMVLYTYRRQIPLKPVAALVLLGAWLIFHTTQAERYLLPAMTTYGAVVLAHHWPKLLDYGGRWVAGSYGMFLWGFLVQQIIAWAGVRDPWLLVICAVPVAYVFGVLSWTFIETPTQRLRRYLRRPPAAKSTVIAVEAPSAVRPASESTAA
jgi:peptidoglycan/LPS O-acetylase OafA/YrhL